MTNFVQWQTSSRNGTTQIISVTNSSTTASNKFGAETWQLRLCSDTPVNYNVTDNTITNTASSTSPFLAANFIEYVTCSPGQTIAAIRTPTDGGVTATNGTLWITEMACVVPLRLDVCHWTKFVILPFPSRRKREG